MEFLYIVVCFVQKLSFILFLLLLVSFFAKNFLFFHTFNCNFQMLVSIWTYRCFNTVCLSLFLFFFFNWKCSFQSMLTLSLLQFSVSSFLSSQPTLSGLSYFPSRVFIVSSTISKAWHNLKTFGVLSHVGAFFVILVLWNQSLSHGIYYNGILQTTVTTCVSN